MIRVIAVGKLKDPNLTALAAMYQRRLRPLARLEVVELRDQAPEVVGRQMLARLGSDAGHEHVVALDESGPQLTSRELADLLGRHGRLAFLIGGPDGHDDTVRARADRLLGLSRMTLPHELARVVLLEQIFRGFSILKGAPYHRD